MATKQKGKGGGGGGKLEERIKKDKEKQNRDCGHSGPGPIYMLPPVLGYPNHDVTRYRNPAFTAAGRHGKKAGFSTPGPVYNPGDYNRFGAKFTPKVTINKRVDYKKKDVGPGPAAYKANVDLTRPSPIKIMIKGRTEIPLKSYGPGPAAYNPNLDLLYPTVPKATLKSRHDIKDTSVGPGPGAYNPGFIGRKPANAIVTGRPIDLKKSAGPGPAYNPGFVGPNAPAFSIVGRPDLCVQPFIDKGTDDASAPYVPHPQRIVISDATVRPRA